VATITTVITTLAVANYRSLRNIVAPLCALNLVSGENGSGKSSLYRALRLLAETAQGGVVASIAREGGLPSETSLHPDLLPALARLILEASSRSCSRRRAGSGRRGNHSDGSS
jgi:predicted ATPase